MIEHAPRETVSSVVPTISCASCVLRINGILRQQRGVLGIHIDLPSKVIQFSYRPDQVALTSITAALEQAQYPVMVLDNHEVV